MGGKRIYYIFSIFSLFMCLIFNAKSFAESSYKIAPGDVIEISIWGEQDLKRELIVTPDGYVSFPLIGDIKVAGKTTSQVKKEVESKIREYVPDAIASVIVTQLGSLQFYVIGKVAKPGMFNVGRPLTVLQALALAGGLTPFADEEHILIIRSYGKNTIKIPFNYKDIKKGKHLEQNILLKRGDVVLVP